MYVIDYNISNKYSLQAILQTCIMPFGKEGSRSSLKGTIPSHTFNRLDQHSESQNIHTTSSMKVSLFVTMVLVGCRCQIVSSRPRDGAFRLSTVVHCPWYKPIRWGGVACCLLSFGGNAVFARYAHGPILEPLPFHDHSTIVEWSWNDRGMIM